MKAIVITEPGGPDVLCLTQRDRPNVTASHIGIAINHAGVNRADLLQRMGHYPAPTGTVADIPGLEYAGTIDTVGDSVTRFQVGDRVYGLVAGGAYADYIVVHEREVARIPDALTDDCAAAIPEAFVTAYDALFVRGKFQPGERVLVHAVGSGVGTAAVQIAKTFGATVIGTSRTQGKLDRALSMGLDSGVLPEPARDGGGPQFADAVREVSGGGVDVVIDLVGGAYVSETVAAMAPRARMVVVGLTAGLEAKLHLGLLLQKRLEIIGTVLRSRPLEEKIAAAQLLADRISPWVQAGAWKPVIDARFALAKAADAHRRVASNETFGKVVLDCR